MRQPAKPKPQAADEAARVLRVFYMLIDELTPKSEPPVPVSPDAMLTALATEKAALLAVAERIAARTEG